MQIQSTLELRNNRAAVTIYVQEFTALEMQKFQLYGAFLVETGGTIEGFYGGEFLSFTLPTEQRSVYNGFPLTKYFSLDDYEDAEKRAFVYSRVVEARIRGERAKLLAKSTILPGDRTYDVNNTAAAVPEYQIETGTETLASGSATHSFTLNTVFAVAPNQFIFSVTNSVDGSPLAITASIQSYDVETQLLTVALSAAPDSVNYVLEYSVAVI
mgnify:CR=1 FL=1